MFYIKKIAAIHSRLLIMLIVLVFGGCKASKLQIQEIDNVDFCQITTQLLEGLQKDEKLKSHFGIDSGFVQVYLDTLVQYGSPFFFRMGVAKHRATKDSISIEDAYSQVELERFKNQENRYQVNCLRNQIEKENAEIQVSFWYSKKDKLVCLDAVNILKKPDYSRGYMYLIEIDKSGEIKRIGETFWNE
jgi:hypothetical protein